MAGLGKNTGHLLPSFSAANTVLPAAGVGATALIGIAVIEVTGQQTAAGVGDTERTMDKHLQLHIGTGLADLLHLLQ